MGRADSKGKGPTATREYFGGLTMMTLNGSNKNVAFGGSILREEKAKKQKKKKKKRTVPT